MGGIVQYKPTRDQMIAMRHAGMGTVTIGKLCGCNASTVRDWLIKYGLPTARPSRIASEERVRGWIKKYGRAAE